MDSVCSGEVADTPKSTPIHEKEPPPLPVRSRRKVACGIRQDRHGFEAHVKVAGRQVSKRFPVTAKMAAMRGWRERTRAELIQARRFDKHPTPYAIPKSMDGWCYVYFIRRGDAMKIGRTEDPGARLRNLQTAHAEPLTLIAAVPAHAALEQAIHERFASLRCSGEWFTINDDLADFVQAVAAGRNPVSLLW